MKTNTTITIEEATMSGESVHGDADPSWANVAGMVNLPAWRREVTGRELVDNREVTIARRRYLVDGNVAVDPRMRLTDDGRSDGPHRIALVQHPDSPSGRLEHTVIVVDPVIEG